MSYFFSLYKYTPQFSYQEKLNTRHIHAIWTFHVLFGHPKVTAYLVVLLIGIFHYSVWAFVNGSDTLMTDLSLLMLLKLNSVYLNVQAIQIPYTKMVFIRLLTIKDTIAIGMNKYLFATTKRYNK